MKLFKTVERTSEVVYSICIVGLFIDGKKSSPGCAKPKAGE